MRYIWWRLIYSIPAWLLYLVLVLLPLVLLGWILIPIAAAFKAYAVVPSTLSDQYPTYHWTWPIMKLWDNEDDGIVDPGYSSYTSMFARIVYWTALRNPVDNLKIVPYVCDAIDPRDVRFIGSFTSLPTTKAYEMKVAEHITGTENYDDWNAETLKYDTKVPQWWFCWNGFYTNFYWAFNFSGHLRLFWIGWKTKPGDIYGVETYRKPRAPSGIQFNTET